jgi:hypothetical protein
MELPLLRQSERGVFKRCQWAWFQQHVVGITPIVEKWKEAADFGTIVHVCLAEYYLPGTKRGPHPAETWQKLAGKVVASLRVSDADDDELKTWEDFYELGAVLLDAYVDRYQGDPHWDIIDAERRFRVVIPDTRVKPLKSEKGKRGYRPVVILVGTIDLCMRDLKMQDNKHRPLVKMLDHKTVGRIPDFTYLIMDEQAGTYIAVGTHALREQGLIEPDQVVRGMEYNYIRRAPLDERPRDDNGMARNKPLKKHYVEALESVGVSFPNDPFKLSVRDLSEYADKHGLTVWGDVSADQSGVTFVRHFVPRTPKERNRQIVRISEEAQVMNMVRTGELPVLKTPTKDCKFCKYVDLCELDESGDDAEYFIKTTMKPYDAYEDHREDATNSKKVTDASSSSEREGSGRAAVVQEANETA